MSSSYSSSLTLFFFFASTFLYTSSNSFNITNILNQNNEFSTFNNLLSQTGLASTINSRQTITVLALSNDAMTMFSSQSTEDNKKSLGLHIVLDYYDIKKLRSIKSVILTTLFQASGQAKGLQGFVNATVMNNGDVMFGSAVRGSGLDSKLIDSVATHPYNISVLHISSYISIMDPEGPKDHGSSSSPLPVQPPGDDDYEYDEPPSPPSSTTKPFVAAATAATAKPPSSAKDNSTTSGVSAISIPNLAFVFVISSFWCFMTVW